ncbi:sigma-70 family RNA polymerase sigma factor [Streptomyces anandii]|uniref:sigma-70 family RNA polymerase sigma factor n=1 Tax=Streptomyces anandii TaxID=285454 RepID=UPI0036F8BE33
MGVDGRGEPLGDGEAGTRGRQPRVPSQGGPAGDPAGVPAQREWREREEDDGPPAVAGRAPSDAELITRMRAGDDTAYEELYRRHAEAVRRYARTCCRDAHTADDLTAEVFARVLQAVRRGSGPEHAVRAYLLTTVRRVAAHWTKTARREQLVGDFALFADQAAGLKASAEDASQPGAEVRAMREAERSMAMRAFRSLPERWQAVLWHTEVEDESPSEVATLFGLDANGTRVLASRAREGLRQAYLQAHVSDALAADEECARYADQLGGYARRRLRTRAERGLRKHLEECARCRLAALQIEEVAGGIPAVVPVAVIGWFSTAGYAKALAVLTGAAGATAGGGTAAGGAAGSGATAGGGAVGGSSGGAGGGSAAAEGLGAPVKAGIAAGVVAVATAAVALALAGHDSPARKPVTAPPPASAPAAEPQSPTPTPPPTPQPTPPRSSPISEPGPKPPVRHAAAKPAPTPAPEPPPTPTPALSPPGVPTAPPTPTPPSPPAPSARPAPAVYRWSELDYDLTGDGARPEMRLGASSWVWQRYGMAIGGKRYTDGVTVHGESSVTIALNRPCTAYDAEAGVDDLAAGLGRVSFSVYADGVRLWRSGPVAAGQPAVPVHVDLAGRDTVQLVVEAPRAFDAVTLADWAESTFTCA